MRFISNWRDLEEFGIIALTGDACGLMYRLLFDLTEQGKQIAEKCFSCRLELAEPWNCGSDDRRHVGSIMLTHEMLLPLGVFALLETGCKEVWKAGDMLIGIEPTDSQETLEATERQHGLMRRFAYPGTAGDRNVHQMTGRTK
jgi:hypothetical protein